MSKHISICVILAALATPTLAATNLRPVLDAIREVETGTATDGGYWSVGDGGRSIGPYQIQYKYWRDSGVPGRYEWVRDRAYAERVVIGYWRKYCPEAIDGGDWQTLARVHNGGPTGTSKAATASYWARVRRALISKR
jgi:hypothetical protein